jgi:glycosyltransferase involved in cell wall biosynthesis
MNVAIVHEWLTNFGGSERCVQAMAEVFPDAPIYTAIWDQERVPQFKDRNVITSFLQRMPGSKRHHAFYLNLMPMAFERFDFREFDVVLSSSHACAKGVVTLPTTPHVCYCHTPTRYLWDFWHSYIRDPSYFGSLNFLVKRLAPFAATYLRLWDRAAADRVDHFIANSAFIAERIRKYYRRESEVVYPPVDVDMFSISPQVDDYYLVLSRLIPYKKVDIAVEAFNQLGLPLKVAGEGPEYKHLSKIAHANIEFLGGVTEVEKINLLARCRGFVFPAEDDFGIVPVEAMASGRPVIAYGRGGALETVIEGKTGTFFYEQTAACLLEAVKRFASIPFDPGSIRAQAERFRREAYKQKIKAIVERAYEQKSSSAV